MQALLAELEDIAKKYRGMEGAPLVSGMPLERDTLRRFVQAIMDRDPSYFSHEYASKTKFGHIVAPPLYPVHAFRPRLEDPDPLAVIQQDPDADGAGGNEGVFFGLEPLESPLKRLLNGGNDIEFYRNLEVGQHCIARARYADVSVKNTKNGPLLLVKIETRFENDAGQLLLINRQTLIWR